MTDALKGKCPKVQHKFDTLIYYLRTYLYSSINKMCNKYGGMYCLKNMYAAMHYMKASPDMKMEPTPRDVRKKVIRSVLPTEVCH